MSLTDPTNDSGEDTTSGEADVKSTAVVQYSRMEQPNCFHELQQNFNLKLPPAKWLHGGTQWHNHMRSASLAKEHQFPSFNMANCFPDLAGDVDVISDAENIKKLLKIPYSKGHISMMVHRVGNSLLLDDFDIHKHLLRQQRSDWPWLRKFYEDTIANSAQKDKCIVKKNKSRHHLQNQNMFSKFLYYSAGNEPGAERVESLEFNRAPPYAYTAAGPLLPDPLPPQKPEYLRTVRWTFEDIHMLIGSDLPIFGGSTHPCVSLRLKEYSKPISVLTGLDYWLDNLMCNVPELAMCYHVDGIVQKYELIKTEEIPNMPESRFSPQVIRDVAQNILSFLKSNTTKEGHTYWLFKGQGDDVVKLYDLTTLCESACEESGQNPFLVPVGILLYRVARNMRRTCGRKRAPTIRRLLENCLHLLDKHEYSQTVTSAHFMLSDLYLADDINKMTMLPASDVTAGNGDVTDSEESTETEDDTSEITTCDDDIGEDVTSQAEDNNAGESEVPGYESIKGKGHSHEIQRRHLRVVESKESDDSNSFIDQSPVVSIDVQTLQKDTGLQSRDVRKLYQAQPPPIAGGVAERCSRALAHVAQGLACVDMSAASYAKSDSQRVDCQAECNPAEAIPLAYKREKTPPAASSLSTPEKAAYSSSLPKDSWHCWSKALILWKAAMSFYGLAGARFTEKGYGEVLKLCKLALLCYSAVKNLNAMKASEHQAIISACLKLSGDSELMLASQADDVVTSHREAFCTLSEEELTVQESARREHGHEEYDWLSEFCCGAQAHLERSVHLYEAARENSRHVKGTNMAEIVKRLANALNELGVFYMNLASRTASDSDQDEDVNDKIVKESSRCFDEGIGHFETLGDKINMSLLHSNKARLMRLCANNALHYVDTGQRHREFSHQERSYFVKAQEEYQRALKLLEKRDSHPDIWDSISWELSSSYFAMATTLQDYAPLTTTAQEQVEREVTELMNKALKYCDLDQASIRQPQCQYRAATIHHRLASLYHNAYRNQLVEQKKKHLRQLAEWHYGKASQLFVLVESPCEMLRLQLERVAMSEYQLASITSPMSRFKILQSTLSHLLSSELSLAAICTHLADEPNADMQGFKDEVEKLLGFFQARLNFVLMHLVKSSSSIKKGKLSEGPRPEIYKEMYSCVLKQTAELKTVTDLLCKAHSLQAAVQQVMHLYQTASSQKTK